MINFHNTHFIKSAPSIDYAPEKKLNEVLFVGKSNVGKSSLINALCQQNGLAKVSSTPGATKYLNYFLLDNKYYIIDAPGYGFVKNNQNNFNEMMNSVFSSEKLKGVVFILDARRNLSVEDKVFYNALIDARLPFVVVLTKSDKLNQSERHKIICEIKKYFVIVKDNEMLLVSSTKKENLNKLKDKIESLLKY